MGDQPVDVVGADAGGFQSLARDLRQIGHGVAEDFASLHSQVTGGLGGRDTTVHIERLVMAPVGAHADCEHASVSRGAGSGIRAQHGCACAIAEEHAGLTVVPIEDARIGFGAHDERRVGRAAPDHAVGHRQRADETRAHGLNIKGDAAGHAESCLYLGRGCGERVVRRGRRQHQEIERVRADARLFQRRPARREGEVGGQLVIGRDVALPDAGAGLDPLVAGVDARAELVVAEHALGEIGAAADQPGAAHG